MNKVFSIFAILLLTSVFMFQSCKKDVEGCTDKDADNYDSEATVSGECKYTGCTDSDAENFDPKANISGTCIFSRDKFIGNYTGSLACPSPLLAAISGTTTFSIDESIAGGKNDVTILISTTTGLVVPVTGTCNGDKVTINTTLQDVSVNVPPLGTIIADITAIGEATYTESNKTLAGPLNLTISYSGLEIVDVCAFSGVKQ